MSETNKLQVIMENANISRSELSEKTGISKRTLELYLGDNPRRNLATAKFETGLKIADALKVSPYDLI